MAGGDPAAARAGEPEALPDGALPVRFEDVRFAYGTEAEVLRGVDLAVEPGEIVAVCGSTGSGKTTLLNLLPRFYDPTGGRVLVGGVDTRDLPVAELRSAVAIVTQKPVLFSVLLRENLLSARPDADWEDVLAACEAAGVSAFVDELPQGYDTLIGERGVNLSGGQRQRVALARALLAGARVLVLDDPMSAVDTETERLLVENLRPAVAGRTVLVATQRLSTIGVADRAVVLDDGRVVEQGTPQPNCSQQAGSSPRSSETSPLPHKHATPGSRGSSPTPASGRGRWRSSPLLAALSAAAPVAGWHLVEDAIEQRHPRGRRAPAAARRDRATSASTPPPGCSGR